MTHGGGGRYEGVCRLRRRAGERGAMSRSVLVADDAALMRMILRDILGREGYAVSEAVNGRDAVERFSEVRPDVAILDITMPELDGLAAMREILRRDSEARVIIVSAQLRAEVCETAMAEGAADFIAKPFLPQRLLDSVRACVADAISA
jgi:two-component system, chemotaxis family, chemotaxis protein CheY